MMPTTSSCLSYKPNVADIISFRWPCKLIVNLSFAKYLAPKLSDTIISYPTLARGVVVRPLDDAVVVEVAAVPRPERVVLRALRKAVAYDLRRRRARLGKRTRARKRAVLEQVSQETRSCSFPLPFSLKGVKGALLFPLPFSLALQTATCRLLITVGSLPIVPFLVCVCWFC